MKNSNIFLVILCLGLSSCDSGSEEIVEFFPETCAEVQENAVEETGDRPDNGTYTLYIDGDESMPWDCYCHNMNRSTPTEYLSVNEADNFSEMSGAATTVTSFRRYRIDPESLEIDPLDDTFASTDGDDSIVPDGRSHIPAGWAQFGDGMGVDGGTTATSQIDLTDTNFTFANSVTEDDFFCTNGSGGGDNSASTINISGDLLSVTLTATNTVPSTWTKTVGDCENLSGTDTGAEDFETAAWPLQYVAP